MPFLTQRFKITEGNCSTHLAALGKTPLLPKVPQKPLSQDVRSTPSPERLIITMTPLRVKPQLFHQVDVSADFCQVN
ncbi:hypothetical protein Hamer_G001819 [Homarus americanus]|uniref:Uncharacterized protein n=1 Tax=Homarus americanus TaxID=6706 RepID=A0A8J5MQV7_HOMAM|nr:hypothetical protein Hamer_G001819 [Homarus americanus]